MHRLARLALIAVLLVAAAPLRAAGNLPFIDDDYAKALAEARARKLPLFIEAWAPW
jgi:endonuclease YncB( thermonuclease family)